MEQAYYNDHNSYGGDNGAGGELDLDSLKLRNGMAWYVVILPALGLFLENYAINIYLGAFLWITVIIASIAVCLADASRLCKGGAADGRIKAAAVFPLLYILLRCRTLRQSNSKVLLMTIFTVFALLNNGFVSAMFLEEEDFKDYVKSGYVTTIEDFSDSMSTDIIDDKLKEYCGEEINYSIANNGKNYSVTATAEKKKLSVLFGFTFDGYAFGDIRILSVMKNGKEITSDEREKLINEIFAGQIGTAEDTEPTAPPLPDSPADSSPKDGYTKA